MEEAADRPELARRYWPHEVHGERDGQDQDLADPGIHCKERGVVEGPEVHRSMDGVRRMMKLRARWQPHLRLAVADQNPSAVPLRDWRGCIEALEATMVLRVDHRSINASSGVRQPDASSLQR